MIRSKSILSIRYRALIAIGFSYAVTVGLLLTFSHTIVLNGFHAVERRDMERNIERSRQALEMQVDTIATKIIDWSMWDDAYKYILDGNHQFEKSSLAVGSLLGMKLELFMWRRPDGAIRYGRVFDLAQGTSAAIPAELVNFFAANASLFQFKDEQDKKHGLVNLPGFGPMLLAIQPIVTSEGTGPIRGALVAGRALNESMTKQLIKLTNLDLSLTTITNAAADPRFEEADRYFKRETSPFIKLVSGHEIAGFTPFPDLFGKPAIYIRASTPREIHAQGLTTIWYFIAALIASCLSSGAVVMLMLEKSVISRVTDLVATIDDIRRSSDLKKRVSATGQDELTTLAQATNEMLASIERGQINLAQKMKDAEVAMKTKASFLANMSHEIRTPLNGVVGNTMLLIDSPLSDDQREMVDTIKSSSDALLALIDDILDFSKLEAGKLQIEDLPFNIHRSIAEAVKILSPAAEEKAIPIRTNLSNTLPNVVVSDHVRFRQILLNLLSNAVKFTKKGEVVIGAEATRTAKDRLTITVSVRDSGIGIAPEHQGKLFQDFSQVDASTTRIYGGTGLGLAISKHLCTLLGGTMWVESIPGQGSTFFFSIAAKTAAGLEPVNVPRYPESSGQGRLGIEHPLRILVAEDNKVNQTIAMKFFKKLGYKVDMAANGEEAVNAATENDYDVIFMDIHMPVIDGFEATRMIRAAKSSKERPSIVALTASVMQSDKQLCFDAGMNGFLKKPIDFSDLKATLQGVSGQRTSPQASIAAARSNPGNSVDFAAILKKFDQDFEILKAVSTAYLDDYNRYLERIDTSIKMREARELEESAHALKGAASNFSSSLVASTAAQLELLGRESRFEEAEKLYKQLTDEAQTLQDILLEFNSRKSVA